MAQRRLISSLMTKNKVLIFGATGMAGHIVYYYLQNTGRYEVVNAVYRTKLTDDSIVVDVTDKDAVANLVRETRSDLIINCIGVLIKGSKDHPDNAIFINAYFPHLLKKLADEVGAKLIHVSTDCVFSGKKGIIMKVISGMPMTFMDVVRLWARL